MKKLFSISVVIACVFSIHLAHAITCEKDEFVFNDGVIEDCYTAQDCIDEGGDPKNGKCITKKEEVDEKAEKENQAQKNKSATEATDEKNKEREQSDEDKKNEIEDALEKAERIRLDKAAAIQQDFDGIIPSPGIEQLDRDGNRVGDIGSKIKDGTVELGDIYIIIIKLMDLLTKLAGTVAVVAIMYGGFQYIMSGFTDEKENAKNTLKYAITGLLVTFLAWLIITVVKTQMTKSPDEYEREAAATSASSTQEFTR